MTKRAKPSSKKKAKPSRVKTSRARLKRSMSAAHKPAGGDVLGRLIDASAHALALPLDPAWKGAIRTNLDVTLRMAAAFADFPLPDDAEPAPVFTA
jgi:1-carboxybiuret hydrolase subunit AtzG-like